MSNLEHLSIKDFASLIGIDRYVPNDRYSQLLIKQMQNGLNSIPELNPREILTAIQELEDGERSRTKAESRFTGPLLNGLWHKHHIQSGIGSFLINLAISCKIKLPEDILQRLKSNRQTHDDENYIFDKCIDQHVRTSVLEEAPSSIMTAYKNRLTTGRATGEWLVYTYYQNQIYYLCLATHDDGDENIRKLIKENCISEFPFLAEIL